MSRSSIGRSGRPVAAVVALAIAVAACGSGPTSSPATTPASTDAPASTVRPSPATAAPTQTASHAPSSSVVVDQTLLDLLPVAVGGVVLTSDPETAANIAADPSLAGNVEAVAVGFAIAPGASDGDDVAIAIVAKLPAGLFDAVFYGAYRDSFDTAACRVAGGVEGAAQADIAGRQVYVGTCSAGAHTYHVYLPGQDAIVSVTSVGALRLGEQVIAGLRD